MKIKKTNLNIILYSEKDLSALIHGYTLLYPLHLAFPQAKICVLHLEKTDLHYLPTTINIKTGTQCIKISAKKEQFSINNKETPLKHYQNIKAIQKNAIILDTRTQQHQNPSPFKKNYHVIKTQSTKQLMAMEEQVLSLLTALKISPLTTHPKFIPPTDSATINTAIKSNNPDIFSLCKCHGITIQPKPELCPKSIQVLPRKQPYLIHKKQYMQLIPINFSHKAYKTLLKNHWPIIKLKPKKESPKNDKQIIIILKPTLLQLLSRPYYKWQCQKNHKKTPIFIKADSIFELNLKLETLLKQ